MTRIFRKFRWICSLLSTRVFLCLKTRAPHLGTGRLTWGVFRWCPAAFSAPKKSPLTTWPKEWETSYGYHFSFLILDVFCSDRFRCRKSCRYMDTKRQLNYLPYLGCWEGVLGSSIIIHYPLSRLGRLQQEVKPMLHYGIFQDQKLEETGMCHLSCSLPFFVEFFLFNSSRRKVSNILSSSIFSALRRIFHACQEVK